MDNEIIFWLVALLGAVVFFVWAIRKANKEYYIEWVNELKDKY